MKNVQPTPKIGQGHAAGMFRAGLKELAQILPATKDSIQPQEEMGIAGNALPQEVFQAKHAMEPNIDQNLEMEV
ncbi:MAG: hypothetical protein KDB27_13025 [Planctomycetales bacterium]|nr:hypothetical protein [Planctomycetales bacterium]